MRSDMRPDWHSSNMRITDRRAVLRALLPLATLAVGLGCLVCAERPAMAGDIAAAEVLFNDGQKLFDAGKIHEACEKFQESYTQDPAIGTMINLARCHEKEGKTASAWAEYKTVETLASRTNQTQRQQYARDEAAKLEPTLHQLVLNIKFPVEGLEISRNATTVGKALWGEKIPVDPGDVVLKAAAPGKIAWSQTVHLAAGPGVDHFDIPKLEDAPVVAPKEGGQTVVITSTGFGTGKIVGLIVAGAGVVAAGVGGGVLALAFSEGAARDKVSATDVKAQLLIPACQTTPPPNTDQCAAAHSKDSHNTASTNDNKIAVGLMIGGGAMLIGGLVTFFVSGPAETTKKVEKTTFHVVPSWTPSQSGLSVVGTF